MKEWKLNNGAIIKQADNGYDFIYVFPPQLDLGETTLEPDEIIPWFKRNHEDQLNLLKEIVPTRWAMSL